ncbi:MAG TPA: hypothetical protein VN025_10110 [Candidatus Dormibacteraeota bacterium]|jgi:hypothetical protein|nr:hypothetical protein [Candidatus Dormibacteraeota bacterium]
MVSSRIPVTAGLMLVFGALASAAFSQSAKKSYELLPANNNVPALFAEGTISTPNDEEGGVFSPDGNEFYFTVLNPTTTAARISLLCVSHWRNGVWSKPEVVAFSGKYFDLPARVSPDGKTLYFSSSRPIPGQKERVLGIWKVERTADGWSEPVALPAPINSGDGHWNWGASVTGDGTMYFTSDRDQPGRPQIYRAKFADGSYQTPEKLGPEINSEFNDSDPFVSADESLLFFTSVGEEGPPFRHRADALYTGGFPYARGEIYASVRVGGKWTQAKHLEHGVNTVADEGYPSLTPDGKFLIFTSGRSAFTVPVAKRLDMQELERNLHSTNNALGNIYTIPVSALNRNEK